MGIAIISFFLRGKTTIETERYVSTVDVAGDPISSVRSRVIRTSFLMPKALSSKRDKRKM